ncbi:unnamed protein product [Strongylus vulgaris]|uniref:Uncharacterized protein n=1 Tax=Strongylus vulgaris TaxID=40348 RepID=A0A3P7IL13_STRVU|nr:unnamed protein product [Strongylus vulgaris]
MAVATTTPLDQPQAVPIPTTGTETTTPSATTSPMPSTVPGQTGPQAVHQPPDVSYVPLSQVTTTPLPSIATTSNTTTPSAASGTTGVTTSATMTPATTTTVTTTTTPASALPSAGAVVPRPEKDEITKKEAPEGSVTTEKKLNKRLSKLVKFQKNNLMTKCKNGRHT